MVILNLRCTFVIFLLCALIQRYLATKHGQVKIHEKKYQELQAAYQRAQTSPKDILNIPLNDVTVTKTVYITTSKPSLPIETCTQLVTDIVTYTTVAPTVTQTSTQLVTAVVTVTPSIQMAPSLQPKVSPTSPQPQASTDSPQPQVTPSSPKPQVVTETATVTVTSTVPQTVIVTKIPESPKMKIGI